MKTRQLFHISTVRGKFALKAIHQVDWQILCSRQTIQSAHTSKAIWTRQRTCCRGASLVWQTGVSIHSLWRTFGPLRMGRGETAHFTRQSSLSKIVLYSEWRPIFGTWRCSSPSTEVSLICVSPHSRLQQGDRMREEKAPVIPVAPDWPTQPWIAILKLLLSGTFWPFLPTIEARPVNTGNSGTGYIKKRGVKYGVFVCALVLP